MLITRIKSVTRTHANATKALAVVLEPLLSVKTEEINALVLAMCSSVLYWNSWPFLLNVRDLVKNNFLHCSAEPKGFQCFELTISQPKTTFVRLFRMGEGWCVEVDFGYRGSVERATNILTVAECDGVQFEAYDSSFRKIDRRSVVGFLCRQAQLKKTEAARPYVIDPTSSECTKALAAAMAASSILEDIFRNL